MKDSPGLHLRAGDHINGVMAYINTVGKLTDADAENVHSLKAIGGLCIAFPDACVHAYCLRDVHRFNEADGQAMVTMLYGQLGNEWNYINAGQGEGVEDRYEYLCLVSNTIHEFL